MSTSIRDALLHEIDAFLARTGMEPSRLGKDAVNDPAFVHRLRAGADVRTRTVDRIREFMAAYRPLARRRRAEQRPAA